jgi:hypothetical protein
MHSEAPTTAVGLVADPGLSYDIARQLADELPGLLAEGLNDQWSWRVPVIRRRLVIDEQGEIRLPDIGNDKLWREPIDVAVC